MMMNAVHIHEILQQDGEILLTGLPYRKGQIVDVIVFRDAAESGRDAPGTADQLLDSELVGLWKDRADLPESTAYARQLREHAQHRERRS
jgi:hypothetical protein